MKRTNKPLLLLGWLLWMAAGGGCTQTEVEEKEIPPHALKDVEVAFNLHVLANQSSTTRSASNAASVASVADTIPTRAGSDMEQGLDKKISNLWVGQYNTSGTLLYHYYNGNMMSNTINVKLKQNAADDDSKCHVWFVINSGDLGEIATEDELKQHVLTYSHDKGLPSPRSCAMSGMWEGVVKEEGGASSITVNVTRLLAKITFSYKIDGTAHAFSFTPDSIMLKSVPDRMQVASTQTQLADVAYQTYKETEFTADADGKVTKYWYLPENMAGIGDAVDAKKNKTGKGVTNATYVKLAGTAVQGGVTYKDVVFCFYPGKDDATVFNNYDIVRNSHYQMDVTLVGLDATDQRITVGEIPPIEVTGGIMPAEKGGKTEVQVTARPGQEWVFDLEQWLKATIEGKDVVTGAQITHQGPAKVTFEATEANPRAEQRSIDFSVNVGNDPQQFTITQEGSTLQKGDDITLGAASGSAAASSFTATKGLKWQVDPSAEDWWSWATADQATSGDDATGTAATGAPQPLNVKALSSNPSKNPRVGGTITMTAGESVGNNTYTALKQEIQVTQSGSTVTDSTINDIAAEGATGNASFTATKGLDWRSAASGDWITLNSGAAGKPTTGASQDINYTVTVNPSSTVRNGTITVQAGNTEDGPTGTIKLIQKAASLTASVTTTALDATPNAIGTLTYQATKGLPLSITAPDWLTLTGEAPGTTTGSEQTIGYKTKSLNLNSTANTRNISVKAGEMIEDLAVTQDASIFTVANGADIIPADGGSTTGSVTATTGLAWTISSATNNDITVSPTSGTGDATLTFTASANTGAARTGTFTVSVTGASPARTASVTVKQDALITEPCIGNLQVCRTDEARTNWSTAETNCNDSTKEKHEDWRLPSNNELKIMYENRSLLESVSGFTKFTSASYWSSTGSSNNNYYKLNFSNGISNLGNWEQVFLVRCVRDINN